MSTTATRLPGGVQHFGTGTRKWYQALPVGEEPTVVTYFNDFLFAGDYSASDWVVTETQAGATQAIAADVTNGALALVNSAADNDVNQLQSAEEWLKLTVGKRLWFDCNWKVSNATESDVFIGLATTDTTIVAGTTDSVGFRKADDATTLVSITEDNTTETTNTAATMVDDTYIRTSFAWDGINKVDFYVNGSKTATHTTNIETTNKLALTFTLQNGSAAARTLTIDYIYVAQER